MWSAARSTSSCSRCCSSTAACTSRSVGSFASSRSRLACFSASARASAKRPARNSLNNSWPAATRASSLSEPMGVLPSKWSKAARRVSKSRSASLIWATRCRASARCASSKSTRSGSESGGRSPRMRSLRSTSAWSPSSASSSGSSSAAWASSSSRSRCASASRARCAAFSSARRCSMGTLSMQRCTAWVTGASSARKRSNLGSKPGKTAGGPLPSPAETGSRAAEDRRLAPLATCNATVCFVLFCSSSSSWARWACASSAWMANPLLILWSNSMRFLPCKSLKCPSISGHRTQASDSKTSSGATSHTEGAEDEEEELEGVGLRSASSPNRPGFTDCRSPFLFRFLCQNSEFRGRLKPRP
mmetsp:Transcript_62797/g.182131  ORF Transcript_62797/g.182131 Transcript_62797/m.182131 type:complete len:360 (+) Transcript_62797:1365-2444(+)